MTRLFLLLCPLLALSSCERPAANSLAGAVVGIADGDTFTLLTSTRRPIKIRLDQIDAPEQGQPWSQNSKVLLEKLLGTGPVRVEVEGSDRYGRTIGRVYAGSVDVNLEMVEEGGAWAYTAFLRDAKFLIAQNRAKESRRGLWSMPAAQTVPPWRFRAERRARVRLPSRVRDEPDAPPSSQTLACGEKRYCRQMSSCSEAISYMRQCGLTRLDGDGDGMPCETICRLRP